MPTAQTTAQTIDTPTKTAAAVTGAVAAVTTAVTAAEGAPAVTPTPLQVRVRVRVRVFHNNQHASGALRTGFQHGHTVTEVFTYSTTRAADTDDLALAEEAFELFNIGDDPRFTAGAPDLRAVDYRARGNRSLSVGDALAIDHRFYCCDFFGWREVAAEPPVEQITARGTAPLY